MSSYYVKIYKWSDKQKKYVSTETFNPGESYLSFIPNMVNSAYREKPIKKYRKKGYFNPFSPNFLTWECMPGVEHISYVEDIVNLDMEFSIYPSDAFFTCIRLAEFTELEHDRFKDMQHYSLYTLVIGGVEYDKNMLKDKIEYFNMVLTNLHNKDTLEALE